MLNIKYSPWPSFTTDESQLVAEVLNSNKVNYWTGDYGKKFEKAFADWCGSRFGIAIANGTLALEVALRAVGVGHGDEVIVPARTFMATASSVSILGATPIFADIDYKSQNISAEAIFDKITDKTKAVICVHLAGWPCDMDLINKLCKPKGIAVIEDCAQAHGAMYKGKFVGTFGDVAAWSFCQDKIMTTGGEGGMVTTNCEDIFRYIWEFKDHGKSYDAVHNREHPPGFRWLHESIGSNYRMTEMQSAIGLYQLGLVDDWIRRRREIASAYQKVFEKYEFVDVHLPSTDIFHSHYRFYAMWQGSGTTRDEFIEKCSRRGIPIYQGSCSEVYLEKAFEGTKSFNGERLEIAKEVGERSLMLLTHPTLDAEEVREICDNLNNVLRELNG